MDGLPRAIGIAVVGALIGAVSTGAGAWLTWAKDVQTRDDVIAIVETHNPYLEDRQLIAKAVEEVQGLRQELFELSRTLVSLQAKLSVIHAELEESTKDP